MTYHYPDPFDRWRYSPYNPQNNDLVDREPKPAIVHDPERHASDSFIAWYNEQINKQGGTTKDWRRVYGQPGGYGKIDPPNSEPTVAYCPHCHRAIGGDRWAWNAAVRLRHLPW